ncbi:MAG TPA: hypothetical protein VH817_14090 [Thermoleophilaceae bacterium]|jgi:protein-S-isoprenylcysteine O-methyltransferase Ste14
MGTGRSPGIALLFGALWMLATLLPTLAIVEFGVIHREERYLARQFGAEYESYRSRTRRWL